MSDTPAVNDTRPLKLSKSKLFNKKEVVDSDRVKLLEAANELVNNMVLKQCVPFINNQVSPCELELTEQEERAYNAALQLLEQQFESGPTAAKVYDVEAEQESESEYGEGKANHD